mmetsp:Transcript_13629/g.28809  ORF Transcript_13629/g.28809 Transcript_13629/m.28809 type:complete len:203 (-) Transcript_13629:51-659(-)
MLAPAPVRPLAGRRHARAVVQPRQELEGLAGNQRRCDPKLVLQLSHRGVDSARGQALGGVRQLLHLARLVPVERVRAARVGPHAREGDFCGGPLLQKELLPLIEEKDAERAMEQAPRLLGVEDVAVLLTRMPGNLVRLVDQDAHVLLHELLLRLVPRPCLCARGARCGAAFHGSRHEEARRGDEVCRGGASPLTQQALEGPP